MELRVFSAGEFGFKVEVEDGDVTLIHPNDSLSSGQCHTLFALLQRPGLPDIKFVREASWSKLSGSRQYSFSCHFLTRDHQLDFGRSQYFASDAEVIALIEHIRSNISPLQLVDALPPISEKPTMTTAKKSAKKSAKPAARPGATRKSLITTIADRTGIPPVDVGLVIDGIIMELVAALQADSTLTLRDLGTFSRQDGEVKFKPSGTFARQIE